MSALSQSTLDALADAETLRRADEVRWRRRKETDVMTAGQEGFRASCAMRRGYALAARDFARSAARAAIRAVPALRDEAGK